MNTSFSQLVLAGLLLTLVQIAAAIPWLLAVDRTTVLGAIRQRGSWRWLLAIFAIFVVLFVGFFLSGGDLDRLSFWGRFYGAALHLQLVAAGLAVTFAVLLRIWPKGAAVALAAFREGIRQPMFWLLTTVGAVLLGISPFVQYFTFGEDLKMVKEVGYDTVMLAALVFGVLAAGTSISEEIEGRTAVTLMSKPVSRRQFLLGKFVGIFLASLTLMLLLGWIFTWILWFKPWYDIKTALGDPVPDPDWLQPLVLRFGSILGEQGASYVGGVSLWFNEAAGTLPGLILSSCQVLVLVAVVVALATRLPLVVTLVTSLVVFFLGHLTPVLVQVAQKSRLDFATHNPGQSSATLELIYFMAQLFNTLLPGLEFFNLGPALARDVPPEPGPFAIYVGTVVAYAGLYAAIALLLGLILFEDRDLA